LIIAPEQDESLPNLLEKITKKGEIMKKEKRKFKRFDAYMNVQFRAQESRAKNQGSGLSKDLSREGLKVNSNSPLKKGDLIDLEIHVPDDAQPVHTTAKVVWSRSCPGSDQGTDYGVSFLMIDPVDKFRVLDYAYNYWLETKVNDFSDPEQVNEIS
jgi:c-di-GMP-binding flagellar brake protein YcgR